MAFNVLFRVVTEMSALRQQATIHPKFPMTHHFRVYQTADELNPCNYTKMSVHFNRNPRIKRQQIQ
jgi:hypothetical protein